MIKKIFFTAVLLLPGLAYGQTPSAGVSVQVVPSVCNNPTPPHPAQAAGFTTLAGCWDFTQQSSVNVVNGGAKTINWTVLSNWLDCAGASSPQWWAHFYSSNVPCSDFAIGPDSGGGQSQVLIMTVHPYPTDPQGSPGGSANLGNTPLLSSTGSPFTSGLAVPATNMYLEASIRADVTGALSAAGGQYNSPIDFYTFFCSNCTQTGNLEVDAIEYFLNNPAPTNNTCTSIVGCWGSTVDNNYHVFGTLVTSNRSNIIGQCIYEDGSGKACAKFGGSTSAKSYSEIGNIFLNNPGNIKVQSGVYNLTGNVSDYWEWVRVWSCPGWNASPGATPPLTATNTCSVASPFTGTPP
jgi:hypothetical protein